MQQEGGGFKFEDERPRKAPQFAFSVQEVSEEEIARAAKATARRERGNAPVREGADPGRFEWPMVAIVLLLLPLVYGLQQWTRNLRSETLSDAPIEVRTSEEVDDPGVSELTIMSKLAVKMAFIAERGGQREQNQPLSQLEEGSRQAGRESRQQEPPSPENDEWEEGAIGLDELEAIAWTRVERMRVAMVAGELGGAPAALTRLESLRAELAPDSALATEIHWLTTIYTDGPEAIPADVRESLGLRHGWFGRLALSFGGHPSDTARWEVVSGGDRVALAVALVIVAMILLSLAGLVVGVLLIVKYRRTGYVVRYEPPAPGGSVFLETFGVFIGGFALLLLVDLAFFGLMAEGTTMAAAFNEILLWSLVLTAAWPLVRGMAWHDWRMSMGWHKGEGIGREVIAGLVGYLGAQPVMWLGSWIGGVVEAATETGQAEASFGYGMFDVPGEGSWALFILGMLSAVVWAPVVEESIFRGALFRHLSGRMNLVWAAATAALCFGFIHPYTPQGLIQVASGGLMYGLMRAWRGSLIAPVVAHALHNGVVSALPLSMVAMLGD